VAVLYEQSNTYRQIYTDGRKLPVDPQPTWMGYSVGRWEGDILVVDATGFNDQGWLDALGHPQSEELRIRERFRRLDFGHMDLELTINDPKTYTKPFTVKAREVLIPDSDVLEYVCTENEKDRGHLGKRQSAKAFSEKMRRRNISHPPSIQEAVVIKTAIWYQAAFRVMTLRCAASSALRICAAYSEFGFWEITPHKRLCVRLTPGSSEPGSKSA
jgi:hypothetical protein